MIFEQITSGGCQSYLLGCEKTREAILIDPNLDRREDYLALAARHGLAIRTLLDTHTHADHFSATCALRQSLKARVAMHPASMAPHADLRLGDGDVVAAGELRLKALHTPGHTSDSLCLVMDDRIFTGDTLLIGGTGRTDLPSGDAGLLHDSLFNKVLKLDAGLTVFPAHEYKGRSATTIGAEMRDNPRLQKHARADFVEMMNHLDLQAPTHLGAALRANLSGGKSDAELVAGMVLAPPDALDGKILVDVRGAADFASHHIEGARHLPVAEIEMRAHELPAANIVLICETGEGAALAAASLRLLGHEGATALAGGMKAWRSR